MLKKLVIGILFVALTGVLIVGAVNRTVAKSTNVNETSEGQGRGWARQQATDAELISNLEGRGQPQGQGRGGNGQGNLANNPANGQQGQPNRGRQATAQAELQDWQVLEGTVTSLDDEQMTLETDAGEVTVTGRSWRFALEQGLALQAGEQVRVQGFYEDGEFAAGLIETPANRQSVAIREQGGRPLWAGGGNSTAGNATGSGGPQAAPQPLAESEDHQWETVEGTVVAIDADQLTVATATGEIQIADRPWDFAQQQGFAAQVGDPITLTGFYENGEFEVGQFHNGASGQVVPIREESGRPLWAGGGRGRAF